MKAIALFFYLFLFSLNLWAIDCEDKKIIKTYKPKFALHFKIHYYENFKIVESLNDKIILSDTKLSCPTKLPVMSSAAKRVIATSTTHLPALSLLNLEEFLVGFQGTTYIFNPAFNKQKIKEISFDLNPEELLDLKPDLVIAYRENLRRPERLGELRKLNIPVVLNHELNETHPLARAEWLIFISSFFNKEKEALIIFNDIHSNYTKIKNDLAKVAKKSVLIGDIQNGFWNTSGSLSDFALLVSDAGGVLFLDQLSTPSNKTQKLSLEKVLSLKGTPDFWLTQNNWKDKRLLKRDSRYNLFSKIPVLNYSKKLNSNGYSDYWETGVARPDLLLLDLAQVIHAEKFPKREMIWYEELK